jgi:hypothetical protein
MKNKNKQGKVMFIVVAFLLLAGFITLVFASELVQNSFFKNYDEQNKKITITTNVSEWKLITATGEEVNLTLWTANAKDKKTQIGFIIKEGKTYNTAVDKYLFYEDNTPILDDKNKPIALKYETAKCGGLNCYHISLTSAQAVNIDNYVKLGNQSLVIGYINETASYVLLNNSCDSNFRFCSALLETTMNSEEKLLEKIQFLFNNVRWYKIFINTSGEKINQNSYGWVCDGNLTQVNNETNLSGCSYELISTLVDAPEWTEYNGGNIKPGRKIWKIEAEKRPSWMVDWVISAFNFDFTEWAIWGNISEGDEAEIIIHSPLNNSISLTPNVVFNYTFNITNGAYGINTSLWENKDGWELKDTTSSYFVLVYASSLTIANFNINNVTATEISSGIWKINSSEIDYEVQRAQVLKTLFYGTDGSNPRIIGSISGITRLESFDTRDVGKRGHLIRARGRFSGGNLNFIGNFSQQSENYNVAIWSYLGGFFSQVPDPFLSVEFPTGISIVSTSTIIDHTGTDRRINDYNNPNSFKLIANVDGGLNDQTIRVLILSSGEINHTMSSGTLDTKIDFTKNYSIPEFTLANFLFTETYSAGENIEWAPEVCDSDGVCYQQSYFVTIDKPNITIHSPASSVSSSSILINATITANGTLDTCYYNITRGASTEKANTYLNCSQFNGTYTLSGEATYSLNIWANTTTGLSGSENKTFVYSASSTPSGDTSGGGGGGFIQQFISGVIKAPVCTQKYPLFLDAWQIFKEDMNWENFKNLLSAYWGYSSCKYTASIIPLELEKEIEA